MSFVFRIGTFFVLLGVALVALFVLSDLAQQPDFRLLILGGLGILLGFLLRWSSPPPERPLSSRFRLFRKKREEKSEKRPH